ncbi:MAG TPA: hypothetical protein VLF59_03090 [Candidatus Saccharimonadales bacterium]|nr:hypothetical protein [Candidatus Saccharimonadales bacterium]
MRPLINKLTPSRGFSHTFYYVYNALLPVIVFLLVRISFVQLALSLILLSKWRMFAVRPRFWTVNIRANAIDIIVGVSVLAFMVATGSEMAQLVWMVLWATWLIAVKPRADVLWVSLQAFIGFAVGLSAVFLSWDHAPLALLVGAAGMLCFFTAHHFFYSFDEPYARMLAYLWAYFGAALAWILGHWLVFYGPVAQPTLVMVTIGLGLGSLYYLDHFDKLSLNARRQIICVMIAVSLVVLFFSSWSDKTV